MRDKWSSPECLELPSSPKKKTKGHAPDGTCPFVNRVAKTLLDRAGLEQIGQVGRIDRIAQPGIARRVDLKDFLQDAQDTTASPRPHIHETDTT